MGFEDREKKRRSGVVSSMISNDQQIVEKKGRPKAKREIKQRISLAILPSLYEDIQKIAYVDRKSVSEIVAELFEQYVQENKLKLKEYEKLNNK